MSGYSTEPTPEFLGDIRQLVGQSRQQLDSTVNSALTLLYWHIGQRIRTKLLQGQRAGYGEHNVSILATQLEAEYGRGFSEKNLRHMLRLAEAFADEPTVSAERRQLSWTDLKVLIYIGYPLMGTILWSGHKNREQSELLELEVSGIRVAEYITALPSKEVLQAKWHQAIALSRARLENRSGDDA